MSTSSVLAMLLLIVLIGLTSSISSVTGLKCWRCHTDGKTCAETTEEDNCNPEYPTCERRFKSDKKMYARGCSKETELGCMDMGDAYKGVFKGQNWCICNTDLCNGDRDGKADEPGQLHGSTGGAGGGGDHGHRRWSLLIAGFALLVPLHTYVQ